MGSEMCIRDSAEDCPQERGLSAAVGTVDDDALSPVHAEFEALEPVSYTHLTLPTSDLV